MQLSVWLIDHTIHYLFDEIKQSSTLQCLEKKKHFASLLPTSADLFPGINLVERGNDYKCRINVLGHI